MSSDKMMDIVEMWNKLMIFLGDKVTSFEREVEWIGVKTRVDDDESEMDRSLERLSTIQSQMSLLDEITRFIKEEDANREEK